MNIIGHATKVIVDLIGFTIPLYSAFAMDESILNVIEWCFDLSRVAHDANVLVGIVELLDALGLCKWHLRH